MLTKTSPGVLRQAWLHEGEVALRKLFESKGYDVPVQVRTSIGFPKGTKDGKKIIGQCWALTASADEHHEIFISPVLGHAGKPTMEGSISVLEVLAHELAHAIAGNKAGHRIIREPDPSEKGYDKKHEKWRMSFPAVAGSVGLVGPWTATQPGEEFITWATPLVKKIGMFPAGALSSFDRKKDGCRQLKCECEDCGYIVRTTKKWIESAGPPICPTDKVVMTCDSPDGGDDD